MKAKLKTTILGMLAIPLLALGALVVAPTSAFAVGTCVDGADIGIGKGIDCSKSDDQQTDLTGQGGVFTIITNVLLFVIGAVSVIMLIIGGIRYTVSGGDSSAVTSAKNTILYAIVGIVVALLAYAVVNFVVGHFVATS
jgi:hypothetical protein